MRRAPRSLLHADIIGQGAYPLAAEVRGGMSALLAANDERSPLSEALVSMSADQLRAVIAHAAGLLAARASAGHTRVVLHTVSGALVRTATLPELAQVFCEERRIGVGDLCGTDGRRAITRCRQEFMWLAAERYGRTRAEIGAFLNRDPSTVSYGVAAHAARAA